MRDVFKQSFSVGMRQWRITAIVYFFQLCLVFTLGMQVFAVLESSIGHSLEVHKLLKSYDHTVLTDFLKVHGASITPLIGELRWLLLAWLIFSVFIDAGLLVCAASPAESTSLTFWTGGARYFFPFFKICLVFLLLALVWTLLVWLPTLVFLEPALEYFPTEKYIVWFVLALLVLYLAGLAVLFLWSVVCRSLYIQNRSRIAACIKNGWGVFRKNWGRLLFFLSVFAVVQWLLIWMYWQLETAGGMTSPVLILVFFVIQQAFVFFRLQLRQMTYAGIYLLAAPRVISEQTPIPD